MQIFATKSSRPSSVVEGYKQDFHDTLKHMFTQQHIFIFYLTMAHQNEKENGEAPSQQIIKVIFKQTEESKVVIL